MGRNHLQHLLRLHYCDSTLNCEELALRINEEATSPTLRLAANKENAPLDLPFIKAAFPMSFREYFLSLGTRVDMLDHPMQTWRPAHGPSIVDSRSSARPWATKSEAMSRACTLQSWRGLAEKGVEVATMKTKILY